MFDVGFTLTEVIVLVAGASGISFFSFFAGALIRGAGEDSRLDAEYEKGQEDERENIDAECGEAYDEGYQDAKRDYAVDDTEEEDLLPAEGSDVSVSWDDETD